MRFRELYWRVRLFESSNLKFLWMAGIFFSCMIAFLVCVHINKREALLRDGIVTVKSYLTPKLVISGGVLPVYQISELHKIFPAKDELPDLIHRLYEVADDCGVVLEQGNYKFVEEFSNETPTRYEIALPTRGEYGRLRSFISQVLQELPMLSLDAISLNRANANDSMVEAELRMTLYLRPE